MSLLFGYDFLGGGVRHTEKLLFAIFEGNDRAVLWMRLNVNLHEVREGVEHSD